MEKMNLIEKITHFCDYLTPFQAGILLSLPFLYILYILLRDKGVPPGPRGIPYFGYWPFLNAYTCHIQLRELSKKYGDVYSLRSTGKLLIHLGSLKAIRDAHLTKSECFGNRITDFSLLPLLSGEGVGIINGEPWKALRKFFVSKFKEYGMSGVKGNTAGPIYDALKESVDEFQAANGSPIEIADMVIKKCILVLRRIIFNDQGITEAELQELVYLYSEMVKLMTASNFLLSGTFANYVIFPLSPSSWAMKRYHKRIEKILIGVVNRQKLEYKESQVCNLIDHYFWERDERLKKGDPTAAFFTDKRLVHSLSQFLNDGILSVGTFIGSFFMTLVEYPDEQDKIYKEILEVVGSDRLPTLEDKNRLPYTTAFMQEVIRCSDFFPLFPSLECTKETTLNGYKIPKGSVTLMNTYAANHNPNDFANPDEFNPSRYLPPPGKPRPDLPILFGVGKRSCMGEAFANMQSFLFLTAVVQNFRLSLPEGSRATTIFSAAERVKVHAHPRSH